MRALFFAFTLLFAQWASADTQASADIATPYVTLTTTQGNIVLELNPEKAPISVANYIKYVESGAYNKTIFHRVIRDFMIQGGGFTEALAQKPTRDPIKNEADNGLFNNRGTIAMARTADVNSATSQFFINLKNNYFLNNGYRDFGYAVFGKVIAGMDVVDAIGLTPTGVSKGMRDVPVEPVIVLSASVSYDKAAVLKEAAKPAGQAAAAK